MTGLSALVADHFAVYMLWMDDDASLPNRAYWLKIGARTVNAYVTTIGHKVDMNTPITVARDMRDSTLRLAANVHWQHWISTSMPVTLARDSVRTACSSLASITGGARGVISARR